MFKSFIILFLVIINCVFAAQGHGNHSLGEHLPLYSIIPFLGILLSIAIFPLLAPHFWHREFGKVSLFFNKSVATRRKYVCGDSLAKVS